MNRDLVHWILGGALAASLGWNLFSLETSAPIAEARPAPEQAAEPADCSAECSLDPRALGLSEEQSRALSRLCAESCADAERLEGRARERAGELRALLSAEALDEAAIDELVDEVSRLRRAALERCVTSVVDVRGVLSPQQVAELLRACTPTGGKPVCGE